MAIHAYNELYLNDAVNSLANAFDYALNVCELDPDWFAAVFANSDLSKQFERGNPFVVSGKSGVELVRDILSKVCPNKELPPPGFSPQRSPQYWSGWALAQYQWASSKCFKDIFTKVNLREIIAMYPTFHEMDIHAFNDSMDRRYAESVSETHLRKMRENRRISQSQLSRLSGVNLRSIQLYEQRANDIDKAQAQTLFKLSRSLGCNVEDLLENPGEFK